MDTKIILVFLKTWQGLCSFLPYIIAGVIIGEILRMVPWKNNITSWTKRSPFLSIVGAAILGIISPLCTYGTVPIIIQLYRLGVPIAPLVTFLSTSSLMNPQLFILTWGGLGIEMALVRTGTVVLIGLILGLIVRHLPVTLIINPNIALESSLQKETATAATASQQPVTFYLFLKKVWGNLEFTGFYLLTGILIGAIIEVFIPPTWFTPIFNNNQFLSVFLAAIMGVPIYACGGGVIPLVRSFISQGMSKGAALAFLLVGPATRATPLVALAALLRPIFIIAYVGFMIVSSLVIGVLYH